MVILENIPKELRPLKQWVLWRQETRHGNKTKIPYQLCGLRTSTTDSRHWSTLDEIINANPSGYSGVGFVFTEDDGFVGLDLDDCRDPITGEVDRWASWIVRNFGSYAEISPSQTGIKIWCTGELPTTESGKKNSYHSGSIEMYHHSRYFTVTGHII